VAAADLGRVKSGSGKKYEVKRDSSCKDVYVFWGGWSRVGGASTAGEAMQKAEARLYNR
jgi:hypothetical protein